MRATLIHNENARAANSPGRSELVSAVQALGWHVHAVSSEGLEGIVSSPGDVVIVAGGDGTVGAVAKRLANTGIPLAVVPTGTVNNIARTLGVGIEALPAVHALPSAIVRNVDLGVVETDGEPARRFIEAFGVGLFAYFLAERASGNDKNLRRAFGFLAGELERYEPHRTSIEVDGRVVCGDYLLVSVLNLQSMGPALRLAPDARFDDGELDLVVLRPEHRTSIVAHLRHAELEGDLALPSLETRLVRRVRIVDPGRWAHLDDLPLEIGHAIDVHVEPGAVRVLVPR